MSSAGAIALLRGGKLHAVTANSSYHFGDGDQFTVVSNEFAKWKGGYRPGTPEEEETVSQCCMMSEALWPRCLHNSTSY